MERDGRRGRRIGLLGLWALSLGLRAAFFDGIDVNETLRADGYRYAALASNLANHGVYAEEQRPPYTPHMRWPPGYPLLLSPFYRGQNIMVGTRRALAAQVLLGAFLPLLAVALGRRLLPAWAAWLAGVLTACCPVLVTTPAFVVSETYYTIGLFLVLGLLWPLVLRPSSRTALLAGAASGGLALIRSSALGLPVAAGALVVARGSGPSRWRAAALLVASAALVTVPWEIRTRIEAARGVPAPSYLARPLAEGIYPDLRYGAAARGYAFLADPRFPGFSTSVGKTLAELWRRTREDPWPNIRWNLVGRWLALWDFHMVQSPPIHIYPVRNGLFRPAAFSADGRDEPLAPVYWLFRTLYYAAVVPGVLAGAVIVVRRRRAPQTPASLLRELLYVVLLYTVLLHGALSAEPRFMIPVRPVLFVLALATVVDVMPRRAAGATPAIPLGNVAALAAGILVAFGLAEAGCRLLLRDRLAVATDERSLLYRYDPTLGWYPRAGEHRRFFGERLIDVAHNALGCRDREFGEKDAGRRRILFLGDSFVWGYDVEAPERFTDLLARRRPDWDVLNCGVSGYGTDQEALLLERLAPQLRPDDVVVEFNPVDRADSRLALNHGGYGKPYFVPEKGGLRLANVPVPLLGPARFAEGGLYRWSYAWRLVRGAVDRSAPRFVTPDVTDALIDRMHATAAAAGARFVILLEGADPALTAHAEARGYGVVALEPALRARGREGTVMRYPGHGFHWTPPGHEVVAALAEGLLEIEDGRVQEARGAWAEAAAAYERARAADPSSIEAAMRAGVVYQHRIGDPERAIGCYRAVLGLDPAHYGAHYQLARALLAAGRTEEARAAWAAFVPLAQAAGDGRSLASAPAALRAPANGG